MRVVGVLVCVGWDPGPRASKASGRPWDLLGRPGPRRFQSQSKSVKRDVTVAYFGCVGNAKMM